MFGTKEMVLEKDRYIGYLESSMGFGNTLGPGLGGFIYEYFGFAGTFLLFSTFIMFGFITTAFFMPNALNKPFEELAIYPEIRAEKKRRRSKSEHILEQLTYKKILMNFECFMTVLIMITSVGFTLYNESILALAMDDMF
jgi:MFS family permease